MEKVVFVDFWGYNGLELYDEAVIRELTEVYSVDILTSRKSTIKLESNKVFFPYSDRFNFARKWVRPLEYFFAWIFIVGFSIRNRASIVHLQWALIPVIDLFFVKTLKILGLKVFMTVHNIHPHRNSGISFFRLNLYQSFDGLLTHSELHTDELRFFGLKNTIVTAFHPLKPKADFKEFPEERTALFLGRLTYEKGLSDLIDVYKNGNFSFRLVIAGKPRDGFEMPEIPKRLNIVVIKRELTQNEVVELIENSWALLTPYRTGTISGVWFDAIRHQRLIVSTRFGAYSEYLSPNYCLLSDNLESLLNSFANLSKDNLSIMINNSINEFERKFAKTKLLRLYQNLYENISNSTVL